MDYETFYKESIENKDEFWAEQAEAIHWHKKWDQVLDYSNPPFAKWFVGGETNLCYNAIDRHLETRGDQKAVIYVSTETNQEVIYTYKELYREVNTFASVIKSMGVGRGDRVIIYMPMMAEAIFAMLACVRLGAIHSVVFGGFAAHNLATRIDDAKPKLMITADAGMRAGKVIPYKNLVDESLSLSKSPPEKVIICHRGLVDDIPLTDGRDAFYADVKKGHEDAEVPVQWVESNEPSYILYTSGTTGLPKGVQHDTGGYAVALAASMKYVYDAEPGGTMLTGSDIGWIVGHSYIVYGPLIHGMATVVHDGLPILPDAGIWWKLVEDYKVSNMFTSPTAIRVLKKEDPKYLKQHDISSLKYLHLAGEPLDVPTARWIGDALGCLIIDHYWQTETGWAILTYLPGLDLKPIKLGSPGFPAYGYELTRVHEKTGEEVGVGEKGVLVCKPPLPPGCLSTVWDDDKRFVDGYFCDYKQMVYTTFDWAIKDEEGYYFILGRTDDVINVAGHRLGTREIEEAISDHADVAEVAVVGVEDEIKGQAIVAFPVLKHAELRENRDEWPRLEKEIKGVVAGKLGAVARPHKVLFVNALPKTRSGKLLRRSIQALAEGRDPGDLTTLEDPNSLEAVRTAVQSIVGVKDLSMKK